MTAVLGEDDIYRTSTQYRLWAFTPESLSSLRTTTNSLAADGVRAAIRKSREQNDGNHHNENPNDALSLGMEVDCLTIEEEQKLVGFYCVKAMQLADVCEFPTNVKVS